ncbi:hypothetical protein J6590_077072 [Homalodisca vitripennis]|nr:hypothetical protein J6590_077072 [Homalodisca vitripennis]
MGPFKLAYMDIHVCPRTSWTRPHRSLSERSAWNIRVDAHAQSTHKARRSRLLIAFRHVKWHVHGVHGHPRTSMDAVDCSVKRP